MGALIVLCLLGTLFFAVRQTTKESVGPAPARGFETIFLGLKWNTSPASYFYLALFMVRRIVFAIIAVLLQDKPVFQLFAIILSSLFMIM